MSEPVRAMTACEAAYLAGLLDGEGCVSARHDGRWMRTTLEVCMTDRAPLDWAHKTTGSGGVYACRPDVRGRRRQAYKWTVSSVREVAAILTHALPWLLVKQSQARAFLVLAHLRSAKRRRTGPVEHPAAERMIANIITGLKRHGGKDAPK